MVKSPLASGILPSATRLTRVDPGGKADKTEVARMLTHSPPVAQTLLFLLPFSAPTFAISAGNPGGKILGVCELDLQDVLANH